MNIKQFNGTVILELYDSTDNEENRVEFENQIIDQLAELKHLIEVYGNFKTIKILFDDCRIDGELMSFKIK